MHRVQRVPTTESQGRIHTSTATVAVLAEADEVEIEIPEKDIEIETFTQIDDSRTDCHIFLFRDEGFIDFQSVHRKIRQLGQG